MQTLKTLTPWWEGRPHLTATEENLLTHGFFGRILRISCSDLCKNLLWTKLLFSCFHVFNWFPKKDVTVLDEDLRTFPAKYMREILLLLFYFVIVNILVGFENPLFCGYF